MIVRQWNGLAKAEREARYLAHFRNRVLPILRCTAGFLGAEVLRREITHGIQITVQTRWASLAAIQAFAGPDLDAVVVDENARPDFHSFDARVSHFEVALEEKA